MRIRMPLLVFACLLAAGSLAAEKTDNLLTNPDFADGLDGWANYREGKAQWDSDEGHPGAGCALVTGEQQMEGIAQTVAVPEGTNALWFSGWCRGQELAGGNIRVGLDLGITLADGRLVWFMPDSAMIHAGDEDWKRVLGRYIAQPGDTIEEVRFFCLNYRNGFPARFDGLSLQAASFSGGVPDVTIIEAATPEGIRRQQVMLKAAEALSDDSGIYPRVPSADEAQVLMIPEWSDSDRFLEQVKTFAYRGGRVVAGWLPEKGTSLALWHWLFDGPAGGITTGRQGTAAGWPMDASPSREQIQNALAGVMAAEWSWPQKADLTTKWPDAPELSFDEHSVLIGRQRRLLFAAGAYQLSEDMDFRAHMAHFADLGMNAAVLYVRKQIPLQMLIEALDAARENDLACLVYLRGGAGTHHPGRPWRADWVAKFAPAADHPAFLAWLTGDDTQSRHMLMMERTHDIIRHYDDRGLVTMTLLDLRRPDGFGAENWTQWRKSFDFPTTYVYTLQRGEGFRTPSAMEGGMVDLQRLGDHSSENFPDLPHLQWVQAHMQQGKWTNLGLSVAERWLPTPPQQGLLMLHALAGGADGLLYFTHATLEPEAGGLGRAMQLKILQHQLSPFADILLTGERRHLQVDGEGVATVFDTGSEAIILLRRVHPYDQAQVDMGREPDLVMHIPESLHGRRMYHIEPLWIENAGSIEPHNETYTMAGLDDWRVFAFSDDTALVRKWEVQLGGGRDAIRSATRIMLTDTYEKTAAVFEVLRRSDTVPGDGAQILETYPSVATFCPPESASDREFAGIVRGRRGDIGRAHQQALQAAEGFWQERSDGPLPEAARTFYGLPHFYQQAGVDLGYEPGQMSEWIARQQAE